MRCPRDNARAKEVLIGTMHVDVCSLCQGMWLEGTELHQLAEHITHHADEFDTPEASHEQRNDVPEFRTARDEAPLACPRGHGPMRRYPYAADTHIVIDRCDTCTGVWLDGWEVLRLWNTLKPNPAHDALVRAYAKHQQEEADRARDRQQYMDLLTMSGRSPGGLYYTLAVLLRSLIIRLINSSEKTTR